jgi:hypothetical protein
MITTGVKYYGNGVLFERENNDMGQCEETEPDGDKNKFILLLYC